MAEGGTPRPGSTTRGSDDVFLHECGSCRYDWTVAEAVGFCVVCEVFLCHNCLDVHKKSKSSRSHPLLEGDDLDTAWRTELPDLAFQYCRLHKANEVSDYCQTHDAVICEVCRAADHRKCTDVKAIEDVCEREPMDKDSVHILEETKSIIGKVHDLQQKRRDEKEECIQNISKFREEITKRLDEIEAEWHTRIHECVTKQSCEINDSLSALENLVDILENESKHMESLRSVGRAKSTFIAIKNIGAVKAAYSDMEKESHNVRMYFQTFDSVDNFLDKERLRAMLKLQSSATCDVGPTLMGNVKDKKITKIGEHCVKFDDDKYPCYITASKFLPTGELLLCDYYNKKLKLMNDKMRAQSSIKLSGSPWDVAVTGEKEAVVTMPHQHKLQFLTYLGEQLKLERGVDIGRECWGVACSKDKLYVTCHNDHVSAEFLILNKQGEIQTRIANRQGMQPYCIAVDGQGRIYVSDVERDTVTCLSSGGQTEYTYTDRNLRKPGHLLVDSDQYVYVCGRDSKNIQVITDKGHKYKNLVTSRAGIVNAWSIAYRWEDGEMSLGQNVNDTVCHFRFS